MSKQFVVIDLVMNKKPEQGFIVIFMLSLLFLIAVLTFSMTTNVESDSKITQNFQNKQEAMLNAEAILPAIEKAVQDLMDPQTVTDMSVAGPKIDANEVFVWDENSLNSLRKNASLDWEKQSQQWWNEHGLPLAALGIGVADGFANNQAAKDARFIATIPVEHSTYQGSKTNWTANRLFEITVRINNGASISTIKSTYVSEILGST
jgi:hypothetical protein